jgi:hypothetical protein
LKKECLAKAFLMHEFVYAFKIFAAQSLAQDMWFAMLTVIGP